MPKTYICKFVFSSLGINFVLDSCIIIVSVKNYPPFFVNILVCHYVSIHNNILIVVT